MKASGIIRQVDELGRLVLPIELRKKMNIKSKDFIEFWVDGQEIILKKYEPSCIFCNDSENMMNYKGKNICAKCFAELKKQRLPKNA